ncbi:MAG: WbqC family protein [Vicingaceae bacterium]
MMKVAIVQPYTFPYLGYFQLIKAVDYFVLYDDVNFIKKGWIHRNRILNNDSDQMFSLPLRKASQNKLINEIDLAIDEKWKASFFKTLRHNYHKAPYFEETYAMVEDVFKETDLKISQLAFKSIKASCHKLGIKTELIKSSEKFGDSIEHKRADRLIIITKSLEAEAYINPQNGKTLYDKNYFSDRGVQLYFLSPKFTPYKQYGWQFKPGLSIIDVFMFNTSDKIIEMLEQYSLT